MLKNIVFDFGNVIMEWNPDEMLNHYHLTPDQHDLLKKVIFRSKEWQEIDAGKLTEKEAEKIFLSKVPTGLQDKVKQVMATWPETVNFYEPVFHLMSRLRKQHYKIYGLSNTGMKFANFVKDSATGDYFDGYVFSAQEKLVKPDPRIYQLLLNRYHLKADECLFIDDIPENTAAAEKLGMYAFTFKIDRLPALERKIKELS